MEPQDNLQDIQPAATVPPPSLSRSSLGGALPSPDPAHRDSREPNHPGLSYSSPESTPSNSRSKVPLERDLTNRLVGVIIWFSLATSAGCVMEMAETKGRPNIAEAMKLGMVAAIACAYKDLEKSRMPLSLLKAPQRFFSKLIVRLDNHSVQLEENTVGQVQLEEKIDALTHRVDTLTLAMVRPPSLSDLSSAHSLTNTPPTPAPAGQPVTSNHQSYVSNGQLDGREFNSHEFNNGHTNGRSSRSLGTGFS